MIEAKEITLTVGDIASHVPEAESQDDDNRIWRSCCFQCDKSAIVFFSTLFVIVILMGYCMYNITVIKEDENKIYYVSLLTMLIGILLPNPKIKGR